MKKRTFLKISSAMVTGVAIAPFSACTTKEQHERLTNWAGNLTYSTDNVYDPKTIAEVQEIIKRNAKLRALGTRHCFNRIADSKSALISTLRLNEISPVDTAKNTVTVGAGIRYGELCKYLDERGYAIHNLASLPHISVAGACATATHGSGVSNGNLATPVSALEFVTANGEIVTLSQEENPEFYGAVVGLGALGIVTKVTLDLLPSFSVRQNVYLNLPMEQLDNHFDEIMSSGYSVSLFTDWQTPDINQVWIKRIANKDEPFSADPEFYGATLATRNVHPIIEMSAESCTEQMGVPGPWYDRLPHFKLDFTPSNGEELQAEFFVPRQDAVQAIKAVATLSQELKPLLMITEIRTIDADNLWMSPCYQQPSIAIHFTLKQDMEGVKALLPKIEEKLAPFGVKPHWGKLFTIPPAALQSRYAKLSAFRELANHYDPEGKFRNDFINRNVF
ncbi:MAG: FAD-binding protein [Cyclobacteriaceae bacterium]|nr:FAD-binding protein [Cyclobacteriaceae bacterium]MDH4296265.1 FAD-binding protein [Cyclobacteriaceae bacterium]MDH5249938.1 FAD-binding protein [Cyclobacteriaceae bacterium]